MTKRIFVAILFLLMANIVFAQRFDGGVLAGLMSRIRRGTTVFDAGDLDSITGTAAALVAGSGESENCPDQ